MTADKQFMLRLSQVTRESEAGPTAMFLALTKCVFIDEKPSHERIAQICNTTNRTLTRNAKKVAELTSKMILPQGSQSPCEKDNLSTTPDNLSTSTDNLSTTPDDLSMDTLKESERERESSPQTPFIEKGKGKENSHSNTPNPPQGGVRDEADANDLVLSEEQKASIRQNHVTQGATMPNHQSEQEANRTKDQTANAPVHLKYEAEFQTFLEVYPKKVYLKGTAYEVLRGAWHGCEGDGWTGELMLESLRCAILSEAWQKENGRFIPIAKRFLEQRMMEKFLPPETVCEVLKSSERAKNFRVVPLKFQKQFEEFCRIYPKRKGLVGAELVATRQCWYDCEVNGWTGSDIVRATRNALTSKRWTDDDGRFIPSATKFLREEQMRQFLPIGFNPRGGSFLGTKKPLTEEEAYWTNLENFA